jgi:hypothetical protein
MGKCHELYPCLKQVQHSFIEYSGSGVDLRTFFFEQLAPSKFHWPEKYRSRKWTDIKGFAPPPPKKQETKDRAI